MPAEMAINNAVADDTGLLPACVAYSIPLTMPVNILVVVSQSPAVAVFVVNWE